MPGRSMRPAHRGKAWLEPDRRTWRLLSDAARLLRMKQDRILANGLLTVLAEHKDALAGSYNALYAAVEAGEFDRKGKKQAKSSVPAEVWTEEYGTKFLNDKMAEGLSLEAASNELDKLRGF